MFIKVGELGAGAFGKVTLVKKKDCKVKTLYAMKFISKRLIKKNDLKKYTQFERHILLNNHNPFLVNLKYAFQTVKKVYLVMEYVSGGSLIQLLRKFKKFSEN